MGAGHQPPSWDATAARDTATQAAEVGDQHRREALEALVGRIAAGGGLAPGLSEQRAVDRAWLLTCLPVHLGAVERCGWTPPEYARWLGESLAQQLLP